ncbi:NtaA/DmoA family FMN-dependent monooxygenase [Rhizobium sp. Root149]|uniref:NtaA/DmoA family FMN-dependent monooxygenase n=1 Tax=Rhizobium sp. Root149 TaxID=1736473 RepID=UPI0019103954|nr:NtaA/DmoA family FMN-dependent monooxygenase [Rhizobium sp. Root149]
MRYAQAAERGGFSFLFTPDFPILQGNLEHGPVLNIMEPMLQLAAISQATRRIGLIATGTTSFQEPFTTARQFKALDVMSHGRVGWNAIPSYEPEAFANYGQPVPQGNAKYERLHEVIQITQALWASWGREAGQPDQNTGRFADMAHIKPVDLSGRHVGARGPLQIPPSEQGQPVIFMPLASGRGLSGLGMYANGILGMPNTVEDSRNQREIVRKAAAQAGRDPDEMKFVPFVGFGLGATKREALDRRRALDERAGLAQRLSQLSMLLGIRLPMDDADAPLTDRQLGGMRGHPAAPKSAQAVQLAQEGWSPRDIIAHGVLDTSPGLVGTPEEAADFLQHWLDAGVCDGFILVPDNQQDSIDAFADQVVPILRQRGLRAPDYAGTTLRDHLGVPDQLGLDRRLSVG